MKKVKFRELEAEFDTNLAKTRTLIDAHKNEAPDNRSTPTLIANSISIFDLAKLSPRSAVLEAWRSVELAAGKLSKGRDPAKPLNIDSLTKLVASGILEQETFNIFNIMRELRNKAAHATDFSVTENQAAEYILASQRLSDRIRKLSDANTDTRE